MSKKEHRIAMAEVTQCPSQTQDPCPGPRVVPGQPKSHRPADTQHQGSVRRLSGVPLGVQGFLRGVGKSISGLHRTYCSMFRGSNEVGEWEELRWFGEEQMWENGGRRGEKEPVLCKEELGWLYGWLCSLSQLLTKLHV